MIDWSPDDWYVESVDTTIHSLQYAGTTVRVNVTLQNGILTPCSSTLPSGVDKAIREWLDGMVPDAHPEPAKSNKPITRIEPYTQGGKTTNS